MLEFLLTCITGISVNLFVNLRSITIKFIDLRFILTKGRSHYAYVTSYCISITFTSYCISVMFTSINSIQEFLKNYVTCWQIAVRS